MGHDSLAAVLAQEGSGDLKIDDKEPYAEVSPHAAVSSSAGG